MKKLGLNPQDLKYILISHGHPVRQGWSSVVSLVDLSEGRTAARPEAVD